MTNEAASEHNHTIASATSSGRPSRPIGSWAIRIEVDIVRKDGGLLGGPCRARPGEQGPFW